MPLYTTTPNPLPIAMGGIGTSLTPPPVDTILGLSTGSDQVQALEIGTNLTSNGSEMGVLLNPTFTDVTLSTINGFVPFTQNTYTPTYTNVANVASFGTVSDLAWFREGNRVTVFGRMSIDPTSASVNTEFGISLPVPSNFSLFTQLAGNATCTASVSLCGAVRADTTNDRANVIYVNTTDTAARDWAVYFSYIVI